MSEIFPELPLKSLPDAVAYMGALPMRVGVQPLPLTAEERATIAALIGDSKPIQTAVVASLAESVRDRREHDHSTQREDWFCMNLTAYMGERMGPVLRRLVDVESENERLRGQVADLLAERHSTNEALDDAVQALRANAQQALPWAHEMPDGDLHGFLGDLVSAAMGRWQSDPEVPDREVLAAVEKACADWRTPGEGFRSDPEPDECTCPPADQPGPHQLGCPLAEVPVSERPVNELTATFAPVAALREVLDGEHFATVHHDCRVGHDLPESGGA